ncbi:MAG TPA: hypothetical protein DCX79_14190 [Planctomycetaceae bacterium]|nr:hypothetical protein [Planctomycetaceae bacterium]
MQHTAYEHPETELPQQQKKLRKLFLSNILRRRKSTKKTQRAHSLQSGPADRFGGIRPYGWLLFSPQPNCRSGVNSNLLWKFAIGNSRTAAPAHFLINVHRGHPRTLQEVPQSEES